MNFVVKNWEDTVLFTGKRHEAIKWCKRYGDTSCEVSPESNRRNPDPDPVYSNWHMLEN